MQSDAGIVEDGGGSVLTSKVVGIIIAVVVLGAVLVPVINGLTSSDNGGGGSGGDGGYVGGLEVPNYPWSGPMQIMSEDLGFTAINKTQAEARFPTVQFTPKQMVDDQIVNGSAITVKNGKCVIQIDDASLELSGTISYSPVFPSQGFRVDGVHWLVELWGNGTDVFGFCTDWSINAQGKISFTVVDQNETQSSYQNVQVTMLGITATDNKGWHGCDVTYGYNSDLLGFNAGDYVGLGIEDYITHEGDNVAVRGCWFGQVNEPVFTIQCDAYLESDGSSIGKIDYEVDLTEWQRGSAYMNGSSAGVSLIAFPQKYQINATATMGFKYGSNSHFSSIDSEDDFTYNWGTGSIDVGGGDYRNVTSSIAKIGTDKYVWENGAVVNKGPSTASDFNFITQEGYGIGTKTGIYVEIEDMDDEIPQLHITSGSLTKATAVVVSPYTTIDYRLGEGMNMGGSGYFAEFTSGNGNWYILPDSEFMGGWGIKLPVQNVGTWDIDGIVIADKENRHYTYRDFFTQSVMQTEDYNQSWGDLDTYLSTYAIPTTLDYRCVRFADISDEPLEYDESGGGSSSDNGGDSVTDTLLKVIPVFVAIAIILAVVGMFYYRPDSV